MLVEKLIELANKLERMGLSNEAKLIDEVLKKILSPTLEESLKKSNETPDPEPFI